MSFGFFMEDVDLNDQDLDRVAKYQEDVQNLMCSSADYVTEMLGRLEIGAGVQATLDRVLWELDLANANPMTVHFDLQAFEPDTGRRVAPVALLEWLAKSDMQYYISEAVWTALPYKENIFFNTNGVFFDGVVRYENQVAPTQTMTTLDCHEGKYSPNLEEVIVPDTIDDDAV